MKEDGCEDTFPRVIENPDHQHTGPYECDNMGSEDEWIGHHEDEEKCGGKTQIATR